MLGRSSADRRRPSGGSSTAASPTTSSMLRRRTLVADVASRATIALGPHQALHQRLARASGSPRRWSARSSALELSSRTSDFREGLASFKEHRSADYQGR